MFKELFSEYTLNDWLLILFAAIALVIWVWAFLVIVIIFGG